MLPVGFRVGTTRFAFVPRELGKPATMDLTLVALDRPTPDFAALFTRNAFPGAPVTLGRRRLADDHATCGAIVINNKISNVCAPNGVENAEQICAAVAKALAIEPRQVLCSSTGIIGWSLPVDDMLGAIPAAVRVLAHESVLPAAQGIMTTDLYPKVRRAEVPGGGVIVGIAKGAGMVEPNMATMLVYLMTDVAVPRAALQAMLARAVDRSFHRISIDSDTSTSDTVVLLSSGARPCDDVGAFERALDTVCADLAEDVVRNGEGVHHVIRVRVLGCATEEDARAVGKTVINSPLVKTAICGNDPNVGRLIAALGRQLGNTSTLVDPSRVRVQLGGHPLFDHGTFHLDPSRESTLVQHLRSAELYASVLATDGVFKPPIDFPPHERCVELEIDLGAGSAASVVLGADLTHEYVSENADYRS